MQFSTCLSVILCIASVGYTQLWHRCQWSGVCCSLYIVDCREQQGSHRPRLLYLLLVSRYSFAFIPFPFLNGNSLCILSCLAVVGLLCLILFEFLSFEYYYSTFSHQNTIFICFCILNAPLWPSTSLLRVWWASYVSQHRHKSHTKDKLTMYTTRTPYPKYFQSNSNRRTNGHHETFIICSIPSPRW